MFADDATRSILAAYERGELITTCGWCGRVKVGQEWVLAPRPALNAIDARYTLSHSICPACTTGLVSEGRAIGQHARTR